VGSHAGFLQSQGQDKDDVDAVATGDLTKAKGLTVKEKALLEYVKILTLEPASMKDADVENLRKIGWKEKEIFEASFDTAWFAFFNRMADAYGLDYPARGWKPPTLATPAVKPGGVTPPTETVKGTGK
jgi:alkylhydroperoxidase family enzyme